MIQPIHCEPGASRDRPNERPCRPTAQPRLLDLVRREIRLRHYSYKTEKTYIHWIVRYVRFHSMRHPEEMGTADITKFLTHLAVGRHVAESTQNQALNAIIFLYKRVLQMDVGDLRHVRAARPERLPVVLTVSEVDHIMQHMSGTYLLLAELMYGTGMRINEVLRLRVMDIDFERGLITVRQGKNRKDRSALLPTWTVPALKDQLRKAKALHEKDLQEGLGTANLPYALDRKYPNASREWKWQFAFPSTRISTDPRSGRRQRHHLYDTNLQRHIRKAAQKAGIQKHVKSHTLRHCFATHLLETGSDIRTIQELLGHADVKTTMIYTHVLKKGPLAVDSPLDRMRQIKEQAARSRGEPVPTSVKAHVKPPLLARIYKAISTRILAQWKDRSAI